MKPELGVQLKELRKAKGERLLDMADNLEVSVAFVSAVENGKKSPPETFIEKVVSLYDLSVAEAESLRRAADVSREHFSIRPETDLAKETAGLMARKVNSLSPSDLSEIMKILKKKDD